MVRPEGVEPPTYWFVASCSIQLSYGRTLLECNFSRIPEISGESNPEERKACPCKRKLEVLDDPAPFFRRDVRNGLRKGPGIPG